MQEEDEDTDDQQNKPIQGVQISSWKYTFELVYLIPRREKQADGEFLSFPIIVWYQYLYWLDNYDEDDVKGYDDDDDDK